MASSYKSWLTFTAPQNYFYHIWFFSVPNQPVLNSSNWCDILQYFPIEKSPSVFLETVSHWSLMFLHLLFVLGYILRGVCILNKLGGRTNLPSQQSASILPFLFNAVIEFEDIICFSFAYLCGAWITELLTPTSSTQITLILWLLLLL